MNEKKEINIMYGLPGSGKTHFSREASKKEGGIYIDLDYEWNFGFTYRKRTDENIKKLFFNIWRTINKSNNRKIYVDGLFTTKKSIVKFLSQGWDCSGTIIIHTWNLDRETCLKNDCGRREKSSGVSIRNMPYDELNSIDDLLSDVTTESKNSFDFQIVKHKVVEKPEWNQYFSNAGISIGYGPASNLMVANNLAGDQAVISSIIESDSGYGSLSSVYDEIRNYMDELYDLLEKVKPGITMKDAREIVKNCISFKEGFETDYYGSSSKWIRFFFSLPDAYDMLQHL